jgi:ABC-type branched-subunit amino acid transport system substrate-binding protein
MVRVAAVFRRAVLRSALAAAALGLMACEPVDLAGGAGGGGPQVEPSGPVRVALLLPGATGAAGDDILSRSLENAARLAVADLEGVRIDLRVYTTGPTAAGAAAAAVRAADEGSGIILGPVYGDAANAAGLAVAARGINVLSFSNNAEIAGGNVFVLGNTFGNIANRLVSYAARQGKGRILIVHEQTAAGEVGRLAIEAAISRAGAQLAGVQSYAFSQEAVAAAAPAIAEAARASAATAVFLTADSAGALPLLAQLLPERGLSPAAVQFLGLTRWDIPAATLTLPGLQGGWFALPDPGLTRAFQARYAAVYGSDPHPIAGLAYDAVAAVGALLRQGRRDALTARALTQASGFVGTGGVFRLRPDGTTERALAVAEVRNGQVIVIDPAPRSFAGAGL